MKVLIILIVIFAAAQSSLAMESDASEADFSDSSNEMADADVEHIKALLGSGSEDVAVEDELFGSTEGNAVSGGSFFGALTRLILSLAVVIALIYLAGILFKRFYGRSRKDGGKDALIQVVEKAYLDSKKAVYLVKVVDRLLIIGVGNNEMRLLSIVKDQSVVDSVKTTDFSYHMKDLFSRFNRDRTREHAKV